MLKRSQKLKSLNAVAELFGAGRDMGVSRRPLLPSNTPRDLPAPRREGYGDA
ncbi:MAG: hypothetical protein H6739_34215 [Alphaproteobacteria bacterium]|nr:hypothetical protein [Alphaproteobacteria bacterium]